jgi:hypothetical protein
MEVARRVIEAPPPDLAAVVPGTPRRAAEALQRGMAKDPAERPATVGQLVRELSSAYAEAAAPAPAPVPAPAPAATPARAPAPARRRGWLVPALLANAAVAVLAVVLLTGGGDERKKPSRQASKPAQKTQPAATSSQPPPAVAATPTQPAPAKALTDFYTRAANDDLQGAWALGTDNLHAQFKGSFAIFRGTFSTLQSIRFPTLRTTSQTGSTATVQLKSVAIHTDRTDRCTGSANLVRTGGRWLVDHIGVTCTS